MLSSFRRFFREARRVAKKQLRQLYHRGRFVSVRRTANAKNAGKRQSARHKKPDEKQQTEKRKKRISLRRKPNPEKCDDETANLNRALVERMLLKNSGFNQGSRSVGGTPICLRRKKHDVNKNLSPMRLNDDRLAAQPATVDTEILKRRSNSVRNLFALSSFMRAKGH